MTSRIICRSILKRSAAPFPLRCLSTVAEKVAPKVKLSRSSLIFQEVSKANSNSTVSDILDRWVNQGKEVKRNDIVSLSNYFRKRHNFQAALQLYDWMETSNLEMNNADQAIRIDVLCKTKGVASAEKYFNSLQASDKTNKTYGALLGCYCRAKVLDKALDLFEEMKASNYISTLNYNNILSLYCSMEQPEKVVSLMQGMEELNFTPDLYTYNILINSYAVVKDFEAIEGVLEKMKSNNVECSLFTLGNLATIYLNAGLREKAIAFLEMMDKAENKGNEGLFEACRTRVKLYSEMNDLSGVNRAWDALKSGFPRPSNTGYLFTLLAFSKLGDLENIEKLFKEWEDRCSSYDMRLPNVLLEYYLNHNMIDKATSLYQSLGNKGTEPNLRTLNAFSRLCVKRGQIDLALEYLNKGLDKANLWNGKWFPSDETIKVFVQYFEENNDSDRAEKFSESMKKVKRVDSNSLLSNTRAASN